MGIMTHLTTLLNKIKFLIHRLQLKKRIEIIPQDSTSKN